MSDQSQDRPKLRLEQLPVRHDLERRYNAVGDKLSHAQDMLAQLAQLLHDAQDDHYNTYAWMDSLLE